MGLGKARKGLCKGNKGDTVGVVKTRIRVKELHRRGRWLIFTPVTDLIDVCSKMGEFEEF